MQRLALILIFLGAATARAADPVDWAVGAEVIAHLQRTVNPDFTTGVAEPVLFGKMRFHPWVALVELGELLPRTSTSGGLSITSRAIDLSVWGHYEFAEPGEWTPYLAFGIGEYFDQVDTSFVGSAVTSRGQRFRVGAGLGVSKSFMDWLLLEAEARGEMVEWDTRPDLSALLRVGVQF